MAEARAQEQKKPRVSEQISAALEEDGKFTYYSGMSFEIHKDSHMTTKYDFQEQSYQYADQTERIDLACVIEAVLRLGTATKPMILAFLHWKKRCFPKKRIPFCEVESEANMRALTTMLKKLCRNGLLVSHDYVANVSVGKKSVIVVYTGTIYGHTLYRNVLEEFMEFDMNSVFRADVASFRMLATNAVMLQFAHVPATTGIYLNGRYGMEKPYKKIKNHVFGLTVMEDQGRKQIFVSEPVFFRFNPETRTNEQVMDYIIDRLSKLSKIIEQIKELDGSDPIVRVIFIVENMEGLGQLFKLIGEAAGSDLFKDALFTSENVVYMQSGDLNRSFLKLRFNEEKGVLQFCPAQADWHKIS